MSAILMAYAFTYAVAFGIAYIDETNCKGWDCQEVYCDPGYAVLVPGKGYLPCEQFDSFIDGDESVLIKKEGSL